ncbi:MAG TPA: hypothetical protein VK421_06395 [Pyrinomonadaceae bacterium]|nr:hypothetical protein [Pyrinomonadaceae bacterium]
MLRRLSTLRLLLGRAVASSLLAAAAFAQGARAQDFVVPPQPAPPPMRYVPEQLRARLDALSANPKDRLRLSLDLMEQSLARVEQHTMAQRFDPATAELGVYLALVDDALAALRPVGRSREGKVDGKTRDLYKRLELTLNKHTARIESVRRATPDIYARNVLEAFRHARARRTEALDSFFVDTIMRPPDDSRATPTTEQRKRPQTPQP